MTTEQCLFNINDNTYLKYCSFLDDKFNKAAGEKSVFTRYLDLGVKVIKLQIAGEEFLKRTEQNFYYSIKKEVKHYDATLYIWKDDIRSFLSDNYKKNKFLCVMHNNDIFIKFFLEIGMLNAQNLKTNSFYFAVNSFSDDVLPKVGHLFVNAIFPATLTNHSSLAHAASVGIDNKGVLICASSGGGKTTLAVSCLIDGFQYVSDDYLILNKIENNLYAHPIYSMVTLTPPIYNRLTNLKCQFMYNNYNNTKYVLDVSAYNNSFVQGMPIKVLIFPFISQLREPTIEKINKGKTVAQFVYSTAKQMDEHLNKEYMKLLISLVKDLDCYQINLSQDLDKNVKILKQFIKEL